MRRFHFRLERVERWRRALAEVSQREHEAAAAAEARLAAALAEHEAGSEALLSEWARVRGAEALEAGLLRAGEAMRDALARGGRELATRHDRALAQRQDALERLIVARREVKVLERLRLTRHEGWRRTIDWQMQKQADEAHRVRLLRAREEQAREPEGGGTGRAGGAP